LNRSSYFNGQVGLPELSEQDITLEHDEGNSSLMVFFEKYFSKISSF